MTEGVMRVFRQEVGRPHGDERTRSQAHVILSRLPLEERFRESSTGQGCRTCCGDHERRFVHQLEAHLGMRLALESPLMGYLVGYTYRTFNGFCERKWGGTPLESLREKRGGQIPRTFPFGIMGFVKPVHAHGGQVQHRWWLFGLPCFC